MTEFKGDKRTKEYAAWKAKHAKASDGLGDTVEKISKANNNNFLKHSLNRGRTVPKTVSGTLGLLP